MLSSVVSQIHKDDVGTIFELTIKDGSDTVDVSGATTKQILYKRPDGTLLTKTAGFKTDGTDGIITYTTIADDLDQIGEYSMQARVVISGSDWHSNVVKFFVYGNLE